MGEELKLSLKDSIHTTISSNVSFIFFYFFISALLILTEFLLCIFLFDSHNPASQFFAPYFNPKTNPIHYPTLPDPNLKIYTLTTILQILKKVCVLSTVCKDVYSKLSSSPSKAVLMNDSESMGNKSDACSGHSSPQSTSSNKVHNYI